MSLYDIEYIGHIYLAELGMVVTAAISVFFGGLRGSVTAESKRAIWWYLVAVVGYVMSDILAHSERIDYLRGWARLVFLLTNILGFLAIFSRRKTAAMSYMLGYILAGMSGLLIDQLPLAEWKFGWAAPITLACVLLTRTVGAVPAIGLMAFAGVSNIFMDFKSLGLICLAAAGLGAYVRWGRAAARALKVVLVMTIALPSLFGVIFVFEVAFSDTVKAERSNDGFTERIAELLAAWQAIRHSPFVGYGSWAKNPDYAAYFIEERAILRNEAAIANADKVNSFDLEAIQAHSQILQAWTEGGILSAAFFMYYAWLLGKCTVYLVMRRQYDKKQFIYFYVMLSGLWEAFFSPFAGDHRLSVGLAFALALCILRETESPDSRQLYKRNRMWNG
jgi:O-antigen ligase